MRKMGLMMAALGVALFLAGCSGVDGVSLNTGAFHKGCTPVAGGVSCTGG